MFELQLKFCGRKLEQLITLVTSFPSLSMEVAASCYRNDFFSRDRVLDRMRGKTEADKCRTVEEETRGLRLG